MESNIAEWVKAAPADRRLFRQAVHLILHGIGGDEYLRMNMIMKGGMLLGIRYQSSRYTEDIDFSIGHQLQDINQQHFADLLKDALVVAEDELPYQVTCRLQSLKVQPKQGGTFPSLKMQIAYSDPRDQRGMQRVGRGDSPKTVKIDYSFNEASYQIEELSLAGEEVIQAYALVDIIAEKLRSVIQQVVRKRNRRQDIYDLWYLLTTCPPLSETEKQQVLNSFKRKSAARLDASLIHASTFSRADVRAASLVGYELLKDEVMGELPIFDLAYNHVCEFYESLPWSSFGSSKNI